MWIEKPVQGSLFGITRLCRVMPNSDPRDGLVYLRQTTMIDSFLLRTIWSPAFDFNAGVGINQSSSCMLTSAILKVDTIHCRSQRLNDRVTWPPIQPMYWQHVLLFTFYLSHVSDKVCKIRFVSTGQFKWMPVMVKSHMILSHYSRMLKH